MKRYNYFADEEQLKALQEIQRKTGVSVSEQTRRAIAEYLKRGPEIFITHDEPVQLTLPFTDHDG